MALKVGMRNERRRRRDLGEELISIALMNKDLSKGIHKVHEVATKNLFQVSSHFGALN